MAGRLKHMERSHRSHNTKENIFTTFSRKAYVREDIKYQKKTLGQRFASLVKPLMPSVRGTADR